MIGRTIGQYRIVAQLGRGGAGTVYKAVDETLNREVAIKVLNPDLADTEVMKRFRAEATTLAKLNHPEIATIYELVRSDTDLLMVMEFVRGDTLDKLLDRLGPMPPDRAAYLVDRILSALEHAHRAGVVHRDMKPANVMVTAVGGVKIMDFGIARVRGAEHVTIDGYLIGTPAYMPPEQVLGQEVDGRADLYSVGVILYRALTGALPFTADTAIGMLQQQISEAPTPLHLRHDGLPEWCETIVLRALAKSPADRFQTAEEFREALARATGIMTTTDLAKAFPVVESEVITTPAQRVPTEKLAISDAESAVLQAVSANGVVGSMHAPKTSTPLSASESGGTSADADDPMIVPRKKHFVSAGSMLAILAASVAVVWYVALRRPATELIGAAAPLAGPARSAAVNKNFSTPLAFETTALVGTGSGRRERDAQLVLADGKVTVTNGNTRHPLHSVPYENVISISYSHSRDPMWNSPKGPATVVHASGGLLGALGIFVERHWISLRTNTEDRFVVLRFSDGLIGKVLSALEERTGRATERVAGRKRKDTL